METQLSNPEELIVIDEESMCLINTETGEVTGYAVTPPDEIDTVKLAEWIGEHVVKHTAAAQGLRAERQVWLDTIAGRYDARIKAHEGAAAFLRLHWYDKLYDLAKTLIGDGKKRSIAVGLLALKLRKSSAKMEVLDVDKAVEWLYKHPAAPLECVKITKSVLVSQIPQDVKEELGNVLIQAESGLAYNPGGEERLVIE
jgi:hypothetical protein